MIKVVVFFCFHRVFATCWWVLQHTLSWWCGSTVTIFCLSRLCVSSCWTALLWYRQRRYLWLVTANFVEMWIKPCYKVGILKGQNLGSIWNVCSMVTLSSSSHPFPPGPLCFPGLSLREEPEGCKCPQGAEGEAMTWYTATPPLLWPYPLFLVRLTARRAVALHYWRLTFGLGKWPYGWDGWLV